MVVVIAGDTALGIAPSYMLVIVGSLAAAAIGICLEFFLFSVDYSGTQQIQFEDDEYYYYVKAVPKVTVSAPEKTVKRINERQDADSENTEHTEKSGKRKPLRKRRAASDEEWTNSRTEEELLKQSLNKELGIEHDQER